MSPISRGFRGRRTEVDTVRLPPGQHLVHDFPVLSAGPTPHTPLDQWTFLISGAVDRPVSWTWKELLALPAETPTVDIHCVTKWSKLGITWKGVSVDTLLAAVDSEAQYMSAWCEGGCTTNLPLEDVTGGRAWIAQGSTASRCTPSTAVRRDSWSRTCISGRAPNGCADWSS